MIFCVYINTIYRYLASITLQAKGLRHNLGKIHNHITISVHIDVFIVVLMYYVIYSYIYMCVNTLTIIPKVNYEESKILLIHLT